VNFPELIWDGELDGGWRVAALTVALRSDEPPPGLSISHAGNHSFVEANTRTHWALATWALSFFMVWYGLTHVSWVLLIAAPFMFVGAMMQSFGRVCVLVKDGRVTVFEGVGGIGRRLDMPLHEIQRVEYVVKRARFGKGSTSWIVLFDGKRNAKFGRHLTDDQIQFAVAFLLQAMQSGW